MSLSSCLEQINKVLPIATEEVEAGNPLTLGARRGRQRQAVEQLTVLKEDYARELLRTSVFVIATGTLADEFCAAAEKFNGFVNDPEEFYNDLASRVNPALYENKTTVSNMFDVLGRHLEDKMRELGVLEYPQMIMKAHYSRTIKDVKDFAALVKESINEQVGAEVVGLQASKSSVDRAIERKHAGSTTLMLLPTQDETLGLALMKDLKRITPNVFVVGCGNKIPKGLKDAADEHAIKKINEEALENVLKNIKNRKM